MLQVNKDINFKIKATNYNQTLNSFNNNNKFKYKDLLLLNSDLKNTTLPIKVHHYFKSNASKINSCRMMKRTMKTSFTFPVKMSKLIRLSMRYTNSIGLRESLKLRTYRSMEAESKIKIIALCQLISNACQRRFSTRTTAAK